PVPWITYPAIDFLSQFDFSEALVFEWGSGFSTIWWAERCKHISAVESNQQWIRYIKSLLPDSVSLIETSLNVDAEVEALHENDVAEYDIIIIDNHGTFRWRCAEAAVSKLAEGGMIVLDNSDQCLKACEVLRAHGLTQIDFTGFAPSNGYAQTTSIFFRGSPKFKAQQNFRPHRSPAQPNVPWPDA
ncbi:MAG: SAM-dependent methyltransferase, partial [Candidatus Binataceae bacterium]